jgi:hypothetical protein
MKTCLIATNFCTHICICGLNPSVLLLVLLRNVRLTVVMCLIAVDKLVCTCYTVIHSVAVYVIESVVYKCVVLYSDMAHSLLSTADQIQMSICLPQWQG